MSDSNTFSFIANFCIIIIIIIIIIINVLNLRLIKAKSL